MDAVKHGKFLLKNGGHVFSEILGLFRLGQGYIKKIQ